MIRASSFFVVKLVLRYENNIITSVTIICLCLQNNVTFLQGSYTEETHTLINAYMQGMVLSHLCFGRTSLDSNQYAKNISIGF